MKKKELPKRLIELKDKSLMSIDDLPKCMTKAKEETKAICNFEDCPIRKQCNFHRDCKK